MKQSIFARAAICVCLMTLAHVAIAASVAIDKSTLQRLVALKPGEEQRIVQFPVGGAELAAVRLKPARIYADDARIIAITEKGPVELPRSTNIFLHGTSDDGRTLVAISLDRDGRFVDGSGTASGAPFVVRGEAQASGGVTLTAAPAQSIVPPGFKFDFKCGDESLALTSSETDSVADQLHAAVRQKPDAIAARAALRYATVAIDTDSLFLSRLFANNTTKATNYIASLFNSMNVMYQNDLQVQLVQGTTLLRTDPNQDPYSDFDQNASAGPTQLNEFANYWQTNESSVSRAFAALLSGATKATANGCSASGYASINAYCDTSRGYSVDQLCTNINVDPNGTVLNSRILGHEIGHNFGAFHTHCTDVSNGDAPVTTNTIDQCYNAEGGCYAGAEVCPADGHGTIMSYCNFGVCGNNVQVNMQFHPTQITKLDGYIATHTPSCLKTTSDEIFEDGFQ